MYSCEAVHKYKVSLSQKLNSLNLELQIAKITRCQFFVYLMLFAFGLSQ